jgi:radical SAM enzyme (TIGR01210 family)
MFASPTDEQILSARPAKEPLGPWRPAAFLVESERTLAGVVEPVATLFLTNRECQFRCTMCDLWRHTLDEKVPAGAIPAQIDYALQRVPDATQIKLYNAGNFFDAQAIPPADHDAIIDRVHSFQSVIVENHPRLTDERCVDFRDRLGTRLQIALGLETIHPEILPRLNKRMEVSDFDRATSYLRSNDIDVRTFLLLKPPGLNEQEGIDWTLQSIRHAFEVGAQCCSVIPTRVGNGFMEQLQAAGEFSPPTIRSMEQVLERALESGGGLVLMDLWDVERFFDCPQCGPARADRIRRMNLSQLVESRIDCDCRRD